MLVEEQGIPAHDDFTREELTARMNAEYPNARQHRLEPWFRAAASNADLCKRVCRSSRRQRPTTRRTRRAA
eukprot:1676619-Prymnesium_polylepis.1